MGKLWGASEWKNDPKEIYNGRLVWLTLTTAFAGCAYGFDQGISTPDPKEHSI